MLIVIFIEEQTTCAFPSPLTHNTQSNFNFSKFNLQTWLGLKTFLHCAIAINEQRTCVSPTLEMRLCCSHNVIEFQIHRFYFYPFTYQTWRWASKVICYIHDTYSRWGNVSLIIDSMSSLYMFVVYFVHVGYDGIMATNHVQYQQLLRLQW